MDNFIKYERVSITSYKVALECLNIVFLFKQTVQIWKGLECDVSHKNNSCLMLKGSLCGMVHSSWPQPLYASTSLLRARFRILKNLHGRARHAISRRADVMNAYIANCCFNQFVILSRCSSVGRKGMAVALDDVQWQVGGEYINADDIGFWTWKVGGTRALHCVMLNYHIPYSIYSLVWTTVQYQQEGQ